MLAGKHIIVVVGGGIAAYKAVLLVRQLTAQGAAVRVVMTPAATRFIGAVTFSGITGEAAVTDLWDPSYAGEVHVELAHWADAVVVAPATQNLLVRASLGLADDAALTTLACFRGPRLFAPAMHTHMWEQPGTQRAVAQLCADGAQMVGPEDGPLASGDEGSGRLAEPDTIAQALTAMLGEGNCGTAGDLTGRSLLVTAGPTAEDLDPVRFLSNRSTGKMGWAIAQAAATRGAQVTLVSGPGVAPAAGPVSEVRVRAAQEMHDAVLARLPEQDAVIMAAAVADYRAAAPSAEKMKKQAGPLSLSLERTPDILAALGARRKGSRPALIGFALESSAPGSEELRAAAKRKLEEKGCDLVVANSAATALGSDSNEAMLVTASETTVLGSLSKDALAHKILDWLGAALAKP